MPSQVPFRGGEKESLHASLNRHREVVLWKIGGVNDEDLRRPITPSGTNLLGLVKHLAAVEYEWFCRTFGRETEPLPSTTPTRTPISVSILTSRPRTSSPSTYEPATPPTQPSRGSPSTTRGRLGAETRCRSVGS